MALLIRERETTTPTADAQDLEGAPDGEPGTYEGEPTAWKSFLGRDTRAELEGALLDLCRFFMAQIAAEQSKSAIPLQRTGIERHVIVQGRNSKGDEGRGSSARAQMFLAAKKLVAEEGWPVAIWYEYAQSAYLKWTRPRTWYQQKYKMVEAGQVKAKIIMPTFSSRKTRRVSEMTAWLDLLEHKGMRMICANQSGHHLDTPLEEVHDWWIDQAKIHQGSSAATSAMIRNKQLEMLGDGIATRGYGRCYGYAPITDPDRLKSRSNQPAQVGARLVRTKPTDGRSEAEWLAYAFEKRLAGLTWADIERECYREGCRGRTGKVILGGDWKRMLTAERVIGCERKNGELFRVRIERLVSDEQYEALMAMEGLDPITGKQIVARGRAKRRRYPLSGLLHCCCGAPMKGSAATIVKGYRVVPKYTCSRPNRGQDSLDGKPWTRGRASDGKQHTTIAAELAHAFIRELCADAIAAFDDELWLAIDGLAGREKSSAGIEHLEQDIAEVDEDTALIHIQISAQRQPGYRGDKMTAAEARAQLGANATKRAMLVSKKLELESSVAPEPVFPRNANVRREIRNCTDGELHVYAKRVFVRLHIRRAEEGGAETPERRIEWGLNKGYRVDRELVAHLLDEADNARLLRYVKRSRKGRDIGTCDDDAYVFARQGLTTGEITRQLNALGHRTATGKELRTGFVARLVRRVMAERDGVIWVSPPQPKKGMSDEQVDRITRMRDGGATWQEVGEAFGVSKWTVSSAYHRRRKREEPGAPPTRRGLLNRNVEVLCWEMRRLEGLSWGAVAREMRRLKRTTPHGKFTWFPATAQHVVEQFEKREPEWCTARRAQHDAMGVSEREAV